YRKTVTVRVRNVDRCRRLVGEINLPDGQNLDHELLRAGLAWGARRYAPGDRTLERLEREAKEAKRGLRGPDRDPAVAVAQVRTCGDQLPFRSGFSTEEFQHQFATERNKIQKQHTIADA
ncbi:MAG: thermonuclease family protein, partial [Bryobacteraceae bacterium]